MLKNAECGSVEISLKRKLHWIIWEWWSPVLGYS
jgi:hypothetical protein